MKKFLLACVVSLLALSTAYGTLPVPTRNFNGVAGNIPTADETAWAYNNAGNGVVYTVIAADNLYIGSSDTSSDTAMHWTGDTFATNHWSEVKLNGLTTTGAGVGQGHGPCVRMATGSTAKTYVRLVLDTHGWELRRCSAGPCTALTSDTTAPVKGDVIRITVIRSGANDIYYMTKNGAALVGSPYTDSSPLSGGAAGVCHSSSTGSGAAVGIDSWTGGNVGGGTIGPIFLN